MVERENKVGQVGQVGQEGGLFSRKLFAMFLFYYIIEGSNSGMLSVFVPIFLIQSGIPGIDEAFILVLAAATMFPFTIKIFWGILSDKFPVKKLGRRRPYISGGIIVTGASWIMFTGLLPTVASLNLGILVILGIIINLGSAISDTALDGLIMDVTPKEKLGQVEGATWACYSVGGILGGTVGILIWTLFGSGAPVLITFGLLSIACGIIIWTVEEPRNITDSFNKKTLGLLLKKKRYWNGYLFSMTSNLANNLIATVFALYLLIKIGIVTTNESGLSLLLDENLFWYILITQLFAAGGIISSSFIIGKLADKVNRKKLFLIILPVSICIISLTIIIMHDLISGLFMAFLVGFASGSMSTMAMTFSATISQENKNAASTHFSIFTSFMNLGSNIGLGLFSAVIAVLLRGGMAPIDVYPVVFITAPLLTLASLFFLKALPGRKGREEGGGEGGEGGGEGGEGKGEEG
ncbi:MAG: MFS transporter [Promethearchaeota archaeon]